MVIADIAFHKLNQGDTKLYSSATNTQVTMVVVPSKVSLAVQQIMIGIKCNNYKMELEILKEIKADDMMSLRLMTL